VSEPPPQLSLEAYGTPRRGSTFASSLRRRTSLKLVPEPSAFEPSGSAFASSLRRRSSGRDFSPEPSAVLSEHPRERALTRELTEDQRVEDVKSRALGLSRKFKIEFYEVKIILEELHKILDRNAGKDMSLKEFSDFLCKVFDVPLVEDRVVRNAYNASQFAEPPIDVNKFLDWYTINMFSEVARILAGDDVRISADLVRALARKFGVHETDIDKAKKAFDKFDIDKSGDIDYGEFTAMMKQMMGGVSDAAQLSEARLKTFWKEIDSDSSGTIDFPEYAEFFVKYFLSGSDFGGIAEAFYASHRPDVQLKALSRRNPQDADAKATPQSGRGVDRSRPLAPLQRVHTIQ